MSFSRYVALGDSQTEGLNDHDGNGGFRGWADRLAEHLARVNPDVRYANLAVRGKLAGQVRAEQLPAAIALEPDLATVVAGMNDLLRPGFDAQAVAAELEAMFAALTASGAQVATCTFPDIGRIMPLMRRYAPRVGALNAQIRAAGARHGVIVVDSEPYAVACDRRMWSADRVHASPLGHSMIAKAFAHALALPGADVSWTHPLAPLPRPAVWQVARSETVWIGQELLPWMVRRLRGRSSGDGITAKRPELLPIFG